MSGRFVRASKYRHVYGQASKRELCYDNLRLTKNAWDTNLIKVNPKYAAVNWEVSGGGAFAVIPLNETGKLPDTVPLFRGHTAAVLDTDWNPFDDQLIASASDDAKVGIYRVPEHYTMQQDEVQDVQPIEKLSGHQRKVGHVLFNPAAANVLASSSGDYTIRLWDLNAKATKLTLKHPDMVTSLSWSADGAMLVTTCRDRKLRYWDVRQEKAVAEVPSHSGAKNSRCVWMGEHDRIATTGFSRMSDRQLALWDLRNSSEPVGGFTFLDSVGSISMPFWDDGTQMLYLAGKGDGNIRMYEYEKDAFIELSEYRSAEPQRGLAFMPKRGINTHDNEIMRAFKTTNQQLVEPISFIVPRRAEVFQGDIYPPTVGLKPSMDSGDYFGGSPAALPPKISLESIYEGRGIKEVSAASVIKPMGTQQTPASSAAPTPKSAVSTAEAATPVKAPTTASLQDSKNSMASMAAKFADKDDDAKSDESSDFEEVVRPGLSPAATRQEDKAEATAITSAAQSPTRTASAPAPAPAASADVPNLPSPTKRNADVAPAQTNAAAADDGAGGGRSVSGATGAAAGIKGMLQDMKAMIAQQGKDLQLQAEKIELLTQEVEALKAKA